MLARAYQQRGERCRERSLRISEARKLDSTAERCALRAKIGIRACSAALLSVLCGARLLHRPSALRSDPLPRSPAPRTAPWSPTQPTLEPGSPDPKARPASYPDASPQAATREASA